jgi:LacI family transcriptional regulator
MRSNQTTIKDIAKALNISPSTVSRALKDHPDISEKTKKAVNELAKNLKYRPNAIALSLRSSKSNTIGVIVPQLVHHFFSSIIDGIENVANEAGYNVIISQSNERYDKEVANTQTMLLSRVDGLLVSLTKETNDISHFLSIIEEEIPVVFFDRAPDDVPADKVIVDDFEGASFATQHLIDQGCKRIAHFSAPSHLSIGKERIAGYKNALKKNGLTLDESLIIPCDNYDTALIETERLLSSENPPDAIFAVNDSSAAAAINVAKKKKIKVPRDLAVIGFGMELIAEMTDPKLSSVDQHGYKMGRKAMELLLQRIRSDDKQPVIHRTEIVPTRLIIRESSLKSEA